MPRAARPSSKVARANGAARAKTEAGQIIAELCGHLRNTRERNRAVWVEALTEVGLLQVMTCEEIMAEATAVYDNYLGVLETGEESALQAYAQSLSERSPGA